MRSDLFQADNDPGIERIGRYGSIIAFRSKTYAMTTDRNKNTQGSSVSGSKSDDPKVEKAEKKAEKIVDDAARRAPTDPQGSKILQDQRDRTTGADQASRDDMGPEEMPRNAN